MQQSETTNRYTAYPRTLTFLFNGDDVLLIHRPLDAVLFPDKYNGVGGHVERGEDVLSAARREVREETGLDVPDLILHGVLHVDEGTGRSGVIVFVFAGDARRRDVVSSREGNLHWISLDQISELNLLPDLPPLLARIVAARSQKARPFFAFSTLSDDKTHWEIHFTS